MASCENSWACMSNEYRNIILFLYSLVWLSVSEIILDILNSSGRKVLGPETNENNEDLIVTGHWTALKLVIRKLELHKWG